MEGEKPSFLRKIGLGKATHYEQHHDELSPEDRAIAGTTYYLRYLGYCPVIDKLGSGSSHAEGAISTIYHEALKKGTKYWRKMRLTINTKILKIDDLVTKMVVTELPLNQISYCSGSKQFGNLFCYITRAEGTKLYHAHTFMCDDVHMARDVVAVFGAAFQVAFRKAKQQQKKKEESLTDTDSGAPKDQIQTLNDEPSRSRAFSSSSIESSPKKIATSPTEAPILLPPPSSDFQVLVGGSKENILRPRASTMPSRKPNASPSIFDDFTELARSRSSTQDEANKAEDNIISQGENTNNSNLLIDLG